MADIKQAIEYAKQNPDSVFATELRKRIESGKMNKELSSAGLNSYIPAKQPSMLSKIVNDPLKTLVVKPATRFGQAIAAPIVYGSGDEQAKRQYEQALKEDVTLPSFTGDINVEAQKGGVEGAKQIVGDAAQAASYLYGGSGIARTVSSGIKGQIARAGTQGAITGGISGGTYGFGESLSKGNDVGTVIEDTLLGAGIGTLTGLAFGAGLASVPVVASKTNNLLKTAKDKTGQLVSDITAPDVPEAVRVSLNPVEALKGTGQDIKVSVGGKLKNLSEITLSDKAKLQSSTQKSINTFTKQAEKFAKDRSVKGGSPVEIVGNRTDTALQFADKKRQSIGQNMGVIEQKYAQEVVPIKDETFKSFVDIVDLANDPKYGVKGENAPVVQKLVEDFDSLNANGLTIEERNKFIRSWQSYLRDAKDAFGNFKENNTVNTQIERAINTIKNETVDAVSMKDKTYRSLRQKYAQYIKLQEIGDMLLGKDGALGQRIKGAATVKRAIQSNSDAGARQFLTALKEITGYDAIKDGDLALTAMESVGDYQGLSLLNILREGTSGVKNKVLQSIEDKLIGSPKERIDRFIQKK